MPTTAELEKRAFDTISKLPKEHLIKVVDFVEYLEHREEIEATQEILADENLLRGIKAGIDDLKAGRCKPWRSVRKNV